MHKVCGIEGCALSDVMAGIQQAVLDGVDIISLSLASITKPYDQDPIAIATFVASRRGIICIAAAGNVGPYEKSVSNVAPWITTVAAGTIDREFPADLLLENGVVITGSSLYNGTWPRNKSISLVYLDCNNEHLPALICGKIVVCSGSALPLEV